MQEGRFRRFSGMDIIEQIIENEAWIFDSKLFLGGAQVDMVSAHKLLHMALWDIRVSFSGFDKTLLPYRGEFEYMDPAF